MKGWIAAVVLVLLYLAYKRDKTLASLVNGIVSKVEPTGNSVSTLSPQFGRTTNLSSTGGTTPGSGVPASQPALGSTWAIGSSGVGAGFVGVTYDHQTGRGGRS